MTEHAETFLSLYRADMDAALQAQPIDSWNSFPLFQLLNNFLRSDGERRRRRARRSLFSTGAGVNPGVRLLILRRVRFDRKHVCERALAR